jgi:hypothetical protein
MNATLYPLLVSPRPWHTVGLDYLTHLSVSNGFDYVLIVVDHLTRIAHSLLCIESVKAEDIPSLLYTSLHNTRIAASARL